MKNVYLHTIKSNRLLCFWACFIYLLGFIINTKSKEQILMTLVGPDQNKKMLNLRKEGPYSQRFLEFFLELH